MGETVTARARRILAEAGGVAGCHYIAAHLSRSPRNVRNLLRRPDGPIRYLGAGYFALQSAPFPPVLQFAEDWLQRHGPCPLDELVSAIDAHYPRGHRRAIRQWVLQEPGRLQQRPGSQIIERCAQRWRTPGS